MGAQSILEKNICSLREEQDYKVIGHAKKHILKKRFDVGKACNPKKVKRDVTLLRILYSENCEVLEHINVNMLMENIFLDAEYRSCGCKGDQSQPTNQSEVFQSDFSDEFE